MPKFKDLKKYNIVKSSNGNYVKVKDEEEKDDPKNEVSYKELKEIVEKAYKKQPPNK